MVFSAVVVLAASAVAVSSGEVMVSQFGYDAADSTKFVQAALDSGARKVVFDRREGPWVTTSVWARSNTEIVFEDGVELLAKRGEFREVRDACLMNVVCVSNVVIRGEGGGGRLRMWIDDYHGKDYKRSEWRHALNIMSSSNVTVEKMSFLKSGGDGIYLGEKTPRVSNRGIVIRDCVCDGNNRQGISVITADGLLIERTVLSNTKGTNPKAGIDFEPNSPRQMLRDIVMRDCLTKGNMGRGYEFYLANFNKDTEPVSAVLENCRSTNDRGGGLHVATRAFKPGSSCPRGSIVARNCRFEESPSAGVSVSNKPYDGLLVRLEHCIVSNSPVEGVSHAASVRFGASSFWTPPVDRVQLDDLRIFQPVEREWFSGAQRPWMRNVTDVSGVVHVTTGGRTVMYKLDRDWCAKMFPPTDKKPDLRVTPFDPSRDWRVVDKAPGARAQFERMCLRFIKSRGTAIVYADSKRRVCFAGRVVPVSAAFKSGGGKPLQPFVVRDMGGKRIAKLPPFGTSDSDRVFKAPGKGFYTLSFEIGKEAIVFSSCDAPFGLLAERDGLDIYRGSGSMFVPHRAGTSHMVLCGGAGGERANICLAAPSGRIVRRWDSLGDWAFEALGEEGLWKLSFAKPTHGSFEDTYANIVGEVPAVFFLTDGKYWQ